LTKPQAIIELTETALRVVAVKGRDAQARQKVFDQLDFAGGLPAALEKTQESLQTLIVEMGLNGAPATIVYESPTASSGVFSCPIAAGLKRAEEAALLSLADTCRFELTSNPHDLKRLAGDRKPEEGSTHPQQVHFAGIADEDASLQAVAAWAERAGVKPAAMVPVESVLLSMAARAALQQADKHGPVAVLCAGERGSALAVASSGRLIFVRSISVGLDDLLAGVTRVLVEASAGPSSAGAASAAATAAPSAAIDGWAWLRSKGIPASGDPGRTVDDQASITAGQVLPKLQPVLQRWTVEIKQSMRFGLSGGGSKDKAKLMVIGPGAGVPRLGEVLAEHAGLESLSVESGAKETGLGAWRGWMGLSRLDLSMVPRAIEMKMRAGHLRKLMIAGCVLAGVAVGVEAWHVRVQADKIQAVLAAVRQEASALEPIILQMHKVSEALLGLAQAQQEQAKRLGTRAPWAEWLGVVASELPPGLALRQLKLSEEHGQPICVIEGETPIATAEASHALVKSLVERLAGLPVTQQCRVSRSQREGEPGRMRQTFELTLKLHALPGTAGPALAGVGETQGDR
jgi:hypothetical protein